MKFVGILLIISSLAYILSVFMPLIKVETNYRLSQLDTTPKMTVTVPLSSDFGIIIPKLGINAKVIKNVDPFNPKVYQKALAKGVAQAQGSSVPGEDGNIFIFAHSSASFLDALKYNSIFYLLPKLNKGDGIDIYYENKEYKYEVADKQVIAPDNTDIMFNKDTNNLVLMTCYPPGTNLKRFIVIAKPVVE